MRVDELRTKAENKIKDLNKKFSEIEAHLKDRSELIALFGQLQHSKLFIFDFEYTAQSTKVASQKGLEILDRIEKIYTCLERALKANERVAKNEAIDDFVKLADSYIPSPTYVTRDEWIFLGGSATFFGVSFVAIMPAHHLAIMLSLSATLVVIGLATLAYSYFVEVQMGPREAIKAIAKELEPAAVPVSDRFFSFFQSLQRAICLKNKNPCVLAEESQKLLENSL